MMVGFNLEGTLGGNKSDRERQILYVDMTKTDTDSQM